MEASKMVGVYGGNQSLNEGIWEGQEKDTQKICVSDEINMKSDSFTVDMERFSHLTNKDLTLNSRINLQRSLSRKGSQKGAEKKMTPSTDNERDGASQRAALVGATMPEKPMVVTVGTTTDHQAINPQIHHQITIMTGHVSPTTTAAAAATAQKGRLIGKRLNSFKRSSIIDPRRILFFFATLSSMGTILLIYFTLSMSKLSSEDNTILQ